MAKQAAPTLSAALTDDHIDALTLVRKRIQNAKAQIAQNEQQLERLKARLARDEDQQRQILSSADKGEAPPEDPEMKRRRVLRMPHRGPSGNPKSPLPIPHGPAAPSGGE